MHWMEKLQSIYPKLLLSFVIVITPICLISLKMNEYGEKNVREKIEDSIQSRVSFYSRLLENEFSRITAMQEEYINDRMLRKLIFSDQVISDIERHEAIYAIHNQLERMVNTSPYIRSAGVYLPSSNRWISDSESSVIDEIPKEQYSALKSLRNKYKNRFVLWDNRLFISLVYSGRVLDHGQEPIFVVGVEIDLRQIKQVLDSFAIGGSGGSMIIDSDGTWAIQGEVSSLPWSEMRDFIGGLSPDNPTLVKEARIQGKKYWLWAEQSQASGITLLSYMPESEIVGSLTLYRAWYWVLSGVSLLLIALFAYWIFLQTHKPMRILMRALQKVENGNWKVAIHHKRQDEFGYLYIQFNSMVSRINELIHEVYEQKYRANLSELRQLQSQINPHFLYNSFFILYRMAKNEENESIARFTSYLGRYFQFITRTHKAKIRLAEEVDFSQAYVEIQSFRFEDRITARFEQLPAAYADLEVPKLILQPVIENVYQHGLRDTIDGGEFEVRFEHRDGCLVIVIEDNGQEMPTAEYEELKRKLQVTEWIDAETTGLVNVHRRLRLEYGERGGIVFNRAPGGGNQVLLRIPIVKDTAA
ncbi:histidine kinase [Paenibacillus sp. GD4]|jgi:two-component system, sensor histidine kinase YesM|uniref:sensor histidine kinase n=1 Tax=Paenibacillus sp. GD4 TaxID=3068890 RepID=UPI0027966F3F|nr:sensor histidine kinase [Paenibacillus sp. GD4]MDQ1908995.1 histidine kinase [Paenibacillus sp. GD4]